MAAKKRISQKQKALKPTYDLQTKLHIGTGQQPLGKSKLAFQKKNILVDTVICYFILVTIMVCSKLLISSKFLQDGDLGLNVICFEHNNCFFFPQGLFVLCIKVLHRGVA